MEQLITKVTKTSQKRMKKSSFNRNQKKKQLKRANQFNLNIYKKNCLPNEKRIKYRTKSNTIKKHERKIYPKNYKICRIKK